MKSQFALVVLCTFLVIGCNNKEEELQQQLTKVQGEQSSLQQSIAERDKYFEDVMRSVNEVYADLEKARSKEARLVEQSGGPEGTQFTNNDSRKKLLQTITDIGAGLKENRKTISSLQGKMKSFRGEITGLNKLVENLKLSLQEREQSIAQLETRVQGLESTVAENVRTISEKETVIGQQKKMITTGFYVVGTRKELEEKGIITNEGGFPWGLFGSTTIMASGVDQSLFTPISKTDDQTIAIQGTIKEILPPRSEAFFTTINPEDSQTSLTIVQPDKFWQDNYLVVVVD